MIQVMKEYEKRELEEQETKKEKAERRRGYWTVRRGDDEKDDGEEHLEREPPRVEIQEIQVKRQMTIEMMMKRRTWRQEKEDKDKVKTQKSKEDKELRRSRESQLDPTVPNQTQNNTDKVVDDESSMVEMNEPESMKDSQLDPGVLTGQYSKEDIENENVPCLEERTEDGKEGTTAPVQDDNEDGDDKNNSRGEDVDTSTTEEDTEDGKQVVEELNCRMDPQLEPGDTVQLDRNKDSPQDKSDEEVREMVGEQEMCWMCVYNPCLCVIRELEERIENLRRQTDIKEDKVGNANDRFKIRKEDSTELEEGSIEEEAEKEDREDAVDEEGSHSRKKESEEDRNEEDPGAGTCSLQGEEGGNMTKVVQSRAPIILQEYPLCRQSSGTQSQDSGEQKSLLEILTERRKKREQDEVKKIRAKVSKKNTPVRKTKKAEKEELVVQENSVMNKWLQKKNDDRKIVESNPKQRVENDDNVGNNNLKLKLTIDRNTAVEKVGQPRSDFMSKLQRFRRTEEGKESFEEWKERRSGGRNITVTGGMNCSDGTGEAKSAGG